MQQPSPSSSFVRGYLTAKTLLGPALRETESSASQRSRVDSATQSMRRYESWFEEQSREQRIQSIREWTRLFLSREFKSKDLEAQVRAHLSNAVRKNFRDGHNVRTLIAQRTILSMPNASAGTSDAVKELPSEVEARLAPALNWALMRIPATQRAEGLRALKAAYSGMPLQLRSYSEAYFAQLGLELKRLASWEQQI